MTAARCALGVNALWGHDGQRGKPLAVNLQSFDHPFSYLHESPDPSALHLEAWKVLEAEAAVFGEESVTELDRDGAIDRVLACSGEDSGFHPKGRLVERDDFTAEKIHLPDLGEGGPDNRCGVIEAGPPIFEWWRDPKNLERGDADSAEAADAPSAVGIPDDQLGLVYLRMVSH